MIELRLDRKSGQIECIVDGESKTMDFGRIAAQTARQVMSSRIREAERDKNLDEYNRRVNSIVTGTIQRIEGGNLIVNMGRVEGIVPRSDRSAARRSRSATACARTSSRSGRRASACASCCRGAARSS